MTPAWELQGSHHRNHSWVPWGTLLRAVRYLSKEPGGTLPRTTMCHSWVPWGTLPRTTRYPGTASLKVLSPEPWGILHGYMKPSLKPQGFLSAPQGILHRYMRHPPCKCKLPSLEPRGTVPRATRCHSWVQWGTLLRASRYPSEEPWYIPLHGNHEAFSLDPWGTILRTMRYPPQSRKVFFMGTWGTIPGSMRYPLRNHEVPYSEPQSILHGYIRHPPWDHETPSLSSSSFVPSGRTVRRWHASPPRNTITHFVFLSESHVTARSRHNREEK